MKLNQTLVDHPPPELFPLQPPAPDSPFYLDLYNFNIGDDPSAENQSATAPSMIPLESDVGPQEKAAANNQLHADDNAPPSPRESPQLSPTAAENDEDASRPAAPLRRRRMVTRACNGCRRKKIRCDGKQPCTHCTVYSYECTYGQPSNRRRNSSRRRNAQHKQYSHHDFSTLDQQGTGTASDDLNFPSSADSFPSTYSPPRVDSYQFRSGANEPDSPDPLPMQWDTSPKEYACPVIAYFGHDILQQPISLQNEYTHVPIGSEQVRLLRLAKGRRDDPIHCSLKVMPISKLEGSQLGYQALSYAWGQDAPTHEIFLQDVDLPSGDRQQEEYYRLAAAQAVPRRFYLRSNLHQALKRLRSETVDFWFWIDAICINQQDDVEKSHQLAKMLDIYCNSWNVSIWIGEMNESESNQHPIDFIPMIVNLKLLDLMVASDKQDEKIIRSWVDFADLLKKPWFGRRWVIQEVAASRRASVHCGSKSINWIDFADAVQLFMAKIDGIRAMYDKSELAKKDPDALSHVESVGANAIVSMTNNVLRKAQNGSVLDRLWNIESLVLTFLHFEAADPRDAIYALLSLASDGHLVHRDKIHPKSLTPLVPDYTKSALQVYIDFIRHCITSSGSLDIICRHWALLSKELQDPRAPYSSRSSSSLLFKFIVPTWIGLVTDSPFGPPSQFTGRLNGDSLVGDPGRRIYNASRGRAPAAYFSEFNVWTASYSSDIDMRPSMALLNDISQTMYAKGIVLSTISRVSSRVVDGTISDDCLSMAGWNSSDDINNISDRLWRTLVADRASDGKSTPFWYRRACMYSLRKTSPDGDLNTSKLIANKSLPETVIEYLKRVQAVVWSRKFLVCKDSTDQSEWLFGLGSRHIKGGDLVCILFGCSVPVVLRKCGDGSLNLHYEFVGECYIHGKMDGEVLAGMDEESIAKATVEFNLQ